MPNIKFNLENKTKFFLISIILSIMLSSCIKLDPKSTREYPTNAKERARKNIEEGRGVSIGNILGNKSNTYEFSTSNPMWRASLDILDFLPLSTVDYSGGLIITDWYNDSYNKDESIKITIQFLSNEVRADSLKIIVHKKNCPINKNCTIDLLDTKIKEQLTIEILKKAALLEKKAKVEKK